MFLNKVAAVMHQYYFCNVSWTSVSPIIAFLDFLFVFTENLQASSIEPNIGKKPNVTHATDSRISI
jgi:hypothetical protein